MFERDGRTYAIVAAGDDGGVQIMDITNPIHPTPISAVFDGLGGFSALGGPSDVEVFERDGRTYAIVTAWSDGGVQIMDITHPTQGPPAPIIRSIYDTTTARLVILFSEPVTVTEPDNISLIRDTDAHMENDTIATLAGAELHTINGQSRSHTLSFSVDNQTHADIMESIDATDGILLAIDSRAIYIAAGFVDITSYGDRQIPLLIKVEILQ